MSQKMKKAYLFERRKKAKELKQKGWTITKISNYLVSGRKNVNKWINMNDEELERDNPRADFDSDNDVDLIDFIKFLDKFQGLK